MGNVAAFLCSDYASGVTGEITYVDAGFNTAAMPLHETRRLVLSLYNKYILPKFLNCACGSKPINYQRQKIVPLATGTSFRCWDWSGLNIPFYNR